MAQVDPPTYDIIIFGASGFTGKYVVRETLKFLNTPNSPLKTLALAGRNPSKLTEALKWANPSHVNIPIITVDISDPLSLKHMASKAKIILNCVGPFHLYGENVVSTCVEAGCDYLDICGEPEFLEKMEAGFYNKAVENGSLVVSACGFDYVPAELGLMFNSRQWVSPAVPNQVEAYLSLESDKKMSLNYGTLESALLWTANADNLAEFRRSRPYRTPPQVGLWGVTFPSADASVVQRTLSILADNPSGLEGVNEDPKQAEKRGAFWSTIKPAHFGVKVATKHLLALFGFITIGLSVVLLGRFSFGRWLLLTFPSVFSFGVFKKGGPTEEQVNSASFKMWFVGKGFSDTNLASQGNEKPDTEIITRVMGPEIGYLTTPIILVQCALILLKQRQDLPKGGVFPPGIVFGPTDLQDRLQENGISFDFISKGRISA